MLPNVASASAVGCGRQCCCDGIVVVVWLSLQCLSLSLCLLLAPSLFDVDEF